MEIKYDYKKFDPESLDTKNIDRLAVEQVPEGSRVLDIGCATGFMGEYLIKKKKCFVYGVEKRDPELQIANKKLTGAINIDVNEEEFVDKIFESFGNDKYDVIMMTSVIEHLVNQTKFLNKCRRLLKKNAIVVVSTPNVAHWTIRLSLLFGKFNYSEYGILDNTHLHLYTIDTFRKLFDGSGYSMRKLLIDPVGGGFPKISGILAKWFPGLFAYQILAVAGKTDKV